MIVYHGSNRNFRTLKISESLRRYDSTKTNEGLGIYFSTDKSVAESYGLYVYTIEINDNYFVDFRKKATCTKYVYDLAQYIYKETNINIKNYINLDDTANRMYWGGLAISGVGREIYLLLDSNEKFYQLLKTKIDRIYQILRTYDKKHLNAYMFNYNIKDIGVIKNVKPEVVQIINKEKIA